MDTLTMPDAVQAIVAQTRHKLASHKRALVIVGTDDDSADHHIIQAALLDAFLKYGVDVTLALNVPENYNARALRQQGMGRGRTKRVMRQLRERDADGHIQANGLIAQASYDGLAWLPLTTAMRNSQTVMFVDAAIPDTGPDMHISLDNRRSYEAAMANSIRMAQPLLREEPGGLHLRNKLMLADCVRRLRQKATGFNVVLLFTPKRHVAGTARPFADMGVQVPEALAGRQAPYHQSLHYLASNQNVPVVAFQLGGYDSYPRIHMPKNNPVVDVSDIIHPDVLKTTICTGPRPESGFQAEAGEVFDNAVRSVVTPASLRIARRLLAGPRRALNI